MDEVEVTEVTDQAVTEQVLSGVSKIESKGSGEIQSVLYRHCLVYMYTSNRAM